jgi:hypothetical protein
VRFDGVSRDWSLPISKHLQSPGDTIDRKIRRQSSKYVMIENELYRRTMERLLLKCLNKGKAHVAMGEVHEGLCGTHQLPQR